MRCPRAPKRVLVVIARRWARTDECCYSTGLSGPTVLTAWIGPMWSNLASVLTLKLNPFIILFLTFFCPFPGKIALGWQLYSMGFLCSPWALHLHTEVCRVFEEMFDEHGDTLAWQYAGSQLVHSIKTYKRTAVFQVIFSFIFFIFIINFAYC